MSLERKSNCLKRQGPVSQCHDWMEVQALRGQPTGSFWSHLAWARDNTAGAASVPRPYLPAHHPPTGSPQPTCPPHPHLTPAHREHMLTTVLTRCSHGPHHSPPGPGHTCSLQVPGHTQRALPLSTDRVARNQPSSASMASLHLPLSGGDSRHPSPGSEVSQGG